jgi:hypothetical protein
VLTFVAFTKLPAGGAAGSAAPRSGRNPGIYRQEYIHMIIAAKELLYG